MYFQYNDTNLITEIKYPGGQTNRFWYDAMLRRYAMEDSAGLSYFSWDRNGMNLLCERDSTSGTIAYYTHGYSVVDGIGSLVAAKRAEAGVSYYQYPVYDHRGTVMCLVDESGTPVAYYEYDAWGNELRDDVVGGTGTNRFRYQSNWIQLTDSNGELYLSPTRLYHAPTGRFLERGRPDGKDYHRYAPFGSGRFLSAPLNLHKRGRDRAPEHTRSGLNPPGTSSRSPQAKLPLGERVVPSPGFLSAPLNLHRRGQDRAPEHTRYELNPLGISSSPVNPAPSSGSPIPTMIPLAERTRSRLAGPPISSTSQEQRWRTSSRVQQWTTGFLRAFSRGSFGRSLTGIPGPLARPVPEG
jgi:hypothetical protein